MEIKNQISLCKEINAKIHSYHLPEGAQLQDMYEFAHAILAFVMPKMMEANDKMKMQEKPAEAPAEAPKEG